MAALKSNQVDAFINNPDYSKPVILIYGPDEGLVSERADKLAEKSGVDLSDPFCLIRLNADDVAVTHPAWQVKHTQSECSVAND